MMYCSEEHIALSSMFIQYQKAMRVVHAQDLHNSVEPSFLRFFFVSDIDTQVLVVFLSSSPVATGELGMETPILRRRAVSPMTGRTPRSSYLASLLLVRCEYRFTWAYKPFSLTFVVSPLLEEPSMFPKLPLTSLEEGSATTSKDHRIRTRL